MIDNCTRPQLKNLNWFAYLIWQAILSTQFAYANEVRLFVVLFLFILFVINIVLQKRFTTRLLRLNGYIPIYLEFHLKWEGNIGCRSNTYEIIYQISISYYDSYSTGSSINKNATLRFEYTKRSTNTNIIEGKMPFAPIPSLLLPSDSSSLTECLTTQTEIRQGNGFMIFAVVLFNSVWLEQPMVMGRGFINVRSFK